MIINYLIDTLRQKRSNALKINIHPPLTFKMIKKIGLKYNENHKTVSIDVNQIFNNKKSDETQGCFQDQGIKGFFKFFIFQGTNGNAIQYRIDLYNDSIKNFKIKLINNNYEGNKQVVKENSRKITYYSKIFDILCRGENIVPHLSGITKLIDKIPGLTWNLPNRLFVSLRNSIEPVIMNTKNYKCMIFHPLACRYMGDNIREFIFINQKVSYKNGIVILEIENNGAPTIEGTILLNKNSVNITKNNTIYKISQCLPGLENECISLLGFDGTWAFTVCEKQSIAAIFRNPSFHSLFSKYGAEDETLLLMREPIVSTLFDLLMDILIKTQNTNGWWDSDDISIPMRKSFGETKGRLDDRRSTNAAWSLYRYYRRIKNKDAYSASIKYFLAIFKLYDAKYVYKESKEGFLFPDYFHPSFHKKPHASLNHNLNLANYCAHIALVDENRQIAKKALQISKGLFCGIRDSAPKWIQKNNDLVYAFYYSKGLKESKDYLTLTYNDLLLSKKLIRYLDFDTTVWIDKLIDSKKKYLEQQGIHFIYKNNMAFPVENMEYTDINKIDIFRAGVLKDIENKLLGRRHDNI